VRRIGQFEQVRLLRDHTADEGVAIGAHGTVLEVFDDGYIVEFSRPDGTTISWFGVRSDEVEPVPVQNGAPHRRSA
jgi:hypothetical protein